VFPTRYELNLYVQFRLILSFKGLINTFAVISKLRSLIQRAREAVHGAVATVLLVTITNKVTRVTKFWSFHGEKDSNFGLLNYDTIGSGMWLTVFACSCFLSLLSTNEVEGKHSSEKKIKTYHLHYNVPKPNTQTSNIIYGCLYCTLLGFLWVSHCPGTWRRFFFCFCYKCFIALQETAVFIIGVARNPNISYFRRLSPHFVPTTLYNAAWKITIYPSKINSWNTHSNCTISEKWTRGWKLRRRRRQKEQFQPLIE
jgi:hypothetical protein